MSNMTKERAAQIAAGGGFNFDEIAVLARIALASLEAEPVSFDDLRDAVAEVSGGPAMEWSEIYKGHQAVPFINFNSLARIVDKFHTAPPAPVAVPAAIHSQGAELVKAANKLPTESAREKALAIQLLSVIRDLGLPENCPFVDVLNEIYRLQSNSPVIPDGWVAVPVELTCEMDDAAWNAYHDTRAMSDIWSALLAAAPQQDVKP